MSNTQNGNEAPRHIAQALEGIKVADFSWVAVGPITGMWLAHHGAEVIRIESLTRPESFRVIPPMKDGIRGINRAGLFANYNTNKLGMSLNLNHPKGIEIAKKIIIWSDVVIESFSSGTMEKWGLGYEDIKKIRPEIIMVSATMMGQTGPEASSIGFGPELISLAGFNHFVGWPDRGPIPLLNAYSDLLTPPIAFVAILTALEMRHKTGKGQWIDVSQLEASLQYLIPAILDYTVNGEEGNRRGNQHFCAVPHNAYRCLGDDRWCVISVFSDEEWTTFMRVIGEPWAQDPEYATLLGRKKREAELDKLIETWTGKYTPEETVNLLQANGIRAGVVTDGKDVLNDPQLRYRSHFVALNHPEMGRYMAEAAPFKLSKTPAKVHSSAPCLGQHTEYVCSKILGISDEDFVDLLNDGVFT